MLNKEAVLIGAGKIGRGYMANLWRKGGYKLNFFCHSDEQAKAMNAQGYYTCFMQSREYGNGDFTKFRIDNYTAYCTETEFDRCAEVLAGVNYATVHLYPGAIKDIGKLIAAAAKKKMAAGSTEYLDIIFVINFLDADILFKKAALENLETAEEKEYLEKYIGFVYGIVRGHGPTPNEEMLKEDPICVSCADHDYLPVDIDEMKNPLPEGVNFIPTHNTGALMKYKVWGGNVGHCTNSYLGKYKGYRWGYEAELDKEVYKCSNFVRREALDALDDAVTVDKADMTRFLGNRTQKPFDPSSVRTNVFDSLDRVGADPVRKLGRNDRYIGPALLSIKQGKVPFFLAKGAALGFYFTNPDDKGACEVQAYLKENGIEKAVEKYCELDLSDEKENLLHQLIVANYYDLSKEDPTDLKYME